MKSLKLKYISCTKVVSGCILVVGLLFSYAGMAQYAHYCETTPYADSIHVGK